MNEKTMHHKKEHHHSDIASCNDLGELMDSCCHAFTHRVGGGRQGRGKILALISQKPGITQKELAKELDIQPASVSELLMKLEKRGLVRREKGEEDRRMVQVYLTEACPSPEIPDAAQDPFQALSPEEQATLVSLLRKLLLDWKMRYPNQGRKHGGRHHHHGHTETEEA